MPVEHLTALQHSQDRKGPWKLYIYLPESEYHHPGLWFCKGPMKYPDEEIPFAQAKMRTEVALKKKLEVRICDGGDMLVFHAKDGKIIFGENFWNEIGGPA